MSLQWSNRWEIPTGCSMFKMKSKDCNHFSTREYWNALAEITYLSRFWIFCQSLKAMFLSDPILSALKYSSLYYHYCSLKKRKPILYRSPWSKIKWGFPSTTAFLKVYFVSLFKVTVDQTFRAVLQKTFGTRVAFNRINIKLPKCRNRRNDLLKIWSNRSNANLTMFAELNYLLSCLLVSPNSNF